MANGAREALMSAFNRNTGGRGISSGREPDPNARLPGGRSAAIEDVYNRNRNNPVLSPKSSIKDSIVNTLPARVPGGNVVTTLPAQVPGGGGENVLNTLPARVPNMGGDWQSIMQTLMSDPNFLQRIFGGFRGGLGGGINPGIAGNPRMF